MPATAGHIYDIACNGHSQRTALLSDKGKVLYHLFDSSDWSLLAKRKPPVEFGKSCITSLDFSSDGKHIALASNDSNFAIGNVNDGQILFQENYTVNKSSTNQNHCRWNPIDPVVATVMNAKSQTSMYLIDTVTQKSIKVKINVCYAGRIVWIDWHKDGNLLALGVCDERQNEKGKYMHEGEILIYDRRSNTISRRFSNCLDGGKDYDEIDGVLHFVKWAPQGDTLVVACDEDKLPYPIKILDYNSERISCEVNSSSDFCGNPSSICFLDPRLCKI